MAIVVEAEAGRKPECPVGRQVPGDNGRQVMRSVVQTEAVTIAKSAVHLNAGNEVLRTEVAALRRSFERKRAARADGVSEFPGIASSHVLGSDRVFGDVPSVESFREQQFELEFVIVFLAGDGVGVGVVGFDVMSFDFFENLVGAAGLLVLEVEHGIDEVLALEKTYAILDAEAGEDRAVSEGGLAVEVEFRGPPGGRAIFEFSPERVEVVAAALRAEGREVFDFEVAGFFQVVIVGDDVRTLLRGGVQHAEQQPRAQGEEEAGAVEAWRRS